MIIMFIIASTTSLASVAVISLAAFEIVDNKARLRTDYLHERSKADKWVTRVKTSVYQVIIHFPHTSESVKWQMSASGL